MRGILIDNPGPKSRLRFSECEVPTCKEDELLVRVHATALNRADLLQRQGKYPPPPGESIIPGLEVAGDVAAIGASVTKFKVGDKVYGLVGGGAYADYCCVHQSLAARIPSGWSVVQAAALPESLVTAHATLFVLGKLTSGQRLLIHAAGSGIASLAIQMAKEVGAEVLTTASTDEKISKAIELGADRVINYQREDFETVLGDQSVDLVVDFIGGHYFPKHLRLLRPQGILIQIACMQGHKAEADLLLLMRKRLQIRGFVLRSQSVAEKALLWQSMQKQWKGALAKKTIQPIIDSTFALQDIEEAHARMMCNEHFGKIVVRVSS